MNEDANHGVSLLTTSTPHKFKKILFIPFTSYIQPITSKISTGSKRRHVFTIWGVGTNWWLSLGRVGGTHSPPSFSPQPPLLLPNCSTKREAGSEKARDPAAIQPLLPLLEDIGLYLGRGEELGQEEPSMGVVGSVFGGAAWETSLMLRPGTYLRPFWTISLI